MKRSLTYRHLPEEEVAVIPETVRTEEAVLTTAATEIESESITEEEMVMMTLEEVIELLEDQIGVEVQEAVLINPSQSSIETRDHPKVQEEAEGAVVITRVNPEITTLVDYYLHRATQTGFDILQARNLTHDWTEHMY